jgi:hypothetical protein
MKHKRDEFDDLNLDDEWERAMKEDELFWDEESRQKSHESFPSSHIDEEHEVPTVIDDEVSTVIDEDEIPTVIDDDTPLKKRRIDYSGKGGKKRTHKKRTHKNKTHKKRRHKNKTHKKRRHKNKSRKFRK